MQNGKVRPFQRGPQETARGTPPTAAFLVHIEVAAAFVRPGVKIIGRRILPFGRRVAERI